MDAQQLAAMYEQGHKLAEMGRYDQALKTLKDYLRYCPQDGQAVNDVATILYCMGRGREAIALYEQACRICHGEQLTQVQWNLCEAYLKEDKVGQAIGLFDTLEAAGVLSFDLLNRAADALLRKELLGPAIELLLRSLRMNPDQEVLSPMIEVIRKHRARTAIVVYNKDTAARALADGFRQRLEIEWLDDTDTVSAQVPSHTQIAIFFGCGQSLVEASRRMSGLRIMAVLDAQDMADTQIQAVHWPGVQTAVLCGGPSLAELFGEQVGSLPAGLNVLTAEPIANPEEVPFTSRKKGKRIAAVGPWDARRNPMYALMCFQKLHYLDPDTRLHLGGTFCDAPTQRYVETLIETLELDNVVFLDGPIKDMKKWLRDKHYILSTSIDGAGLEDVWLAMAYGLRPVVHTFPGLNERLDAAYAFTLAEDFCDQVLRGSYDSTTYRQEIEQVYLERGLEPMVMDQIFRFEQELCIGRGREVAESSPAAPVSSPRPMFNSKPVSHSSVEQIASDALAAAQSISALEPDTPIDGRDVFDPTVPDTRDEQENLSDYYTPDGLSVEEMTAARRGNMQRRRRSPASML